MTAMTRFKTIRWLILGVCSLALLACLGISWNWSTLRVSFTTRQLQQATSDEERKALAERLLGHGEPGWQAAQRLLESDSSAAAALLEVLIQQLDATRNPEPAQRLLHSSVSWTPTNQARLLPLLARGSQDALDTATRLRCREIVRHGLASDVAEVQLRAMRLAIRPDFQLISEVVPLLRSPEATVRRVAMLAVGPVHDDLAPLIGTEDLFPWLHDPDAEVRHLCRTALLTRGLEDEQINFATLLSSPRATDRLKLLTELQFSEATSLGPWLERLSHDAEPAVRLGSARVAAELNLGFNNWLNRLAEQDSDPTVRRWAAYYRQLAPLRQASDSR